MIRSTDDSLFDHHDRQDADQFDYDGLDATDRPACGYDPETGRWLNDEPVGFADGASEYRYVGNAPRNVTDPTAVRDRNGGRNRFQRNEVNRD